MEVLHTIGEFRRARADIRGRLGFVPTMGYLHEGHMELVRRARAENDVVAVSIFVNPTQFGPNEDLAAYPRDLERDLAMLRREQTTLVFNPTPDVMYPPGYASSIDVGPVSQPLEGARRPGHFRGVATVVAKLFNVVRPNKAYFGQKDGQQVLVIQRMVTDLDFPVDIVVVPTVREPDGLAMSSRNVYLDPAQRQAAKCLWQGLARAEERWKRGERDPGTLRRLVSEPIEREPLAVIDYISIADAETLSEVATPLSASGEGPGVRSPVEHRVRSPAAGAIMISLAVRFGETRLIDNIILRG